MKTLLSTFGFTRLRVNQDSAEAAHADKAWREGGGNRDELTSSLNEEEALVSSENWSTYTESRRVELGSDEL